MTDIVESFLVPLIAIILLSILLVGCSSIEKTGDVNFSTSWNTGGGKVSTMSEEKPQDWNRTPQRGNDEKSSKTPEGTSN